MIRAAGPPHRGRCLPFFTRTVRRNSSMTQSWFPWLRHGSRAARNENSARHIPTPAVLCAAVLGAGGPYRLERAHGPEQCRQRHGSLPIDTAAQSGDTIVFDPSLAIRDDHFEQRPAGYKQQPHDRWPGPRPVVHQRQQCQPTVAAERYGPGHLRQPHADRGLVDGGREAKGERSLLAEVRRFVEQRHPVR